MQLKVLYPSPPSDGVVHTLLSAVPDVCLVDASEAEILIEGRPASEQVDAMPRLRAIVVPFAGVPESTLELVRTRPHLSLHNLHHNAPETAELAVALLMAAAKRIVPQDNLMRRHDWSPRYEPSKSVLLDGKTALVLGYGEIGRRIARSCRALGMNVLATRASVTTVTQNEDAEVYPASHLRDLLPRAGALLIALPLTSTTAELLGSEELGLLPPGALLVNIARARIVEERALYEALNSGRLQAAGLDVWYQYPKEKESKGSQSVPTYYDMPASATNTPPSAFPFHELDNVVMSPHRGGMTIDTEKRRVEHLADMLRAAANGEPMPNLVNVDAGY